MSKNGELVVKLTLLHTDATAFWSLCRNDRLAVNTSYELNARDLRTTAFRRSLGTTALGTLERRLAIISACNLAFDKCVFPLMCGQFKQPSKMKKSVSCLNRIG